MTYNVFGGTLSLTQSINQQSYPLTMCVPVVDRPLVLSVRTASGFAFAVGLSCLEYKTPSTRRY